VPPSLSPKLWGGEFVEGQNPFASNEHDPGEQEKDTGSGENQ